MNNQYTCTHTTILNQYNWRLAPWNGYTAILNKHRGSVWIKRAAEPPLRIHWHRSHCTSFQKIWTTTTHSPLERPHARCTTTNPKNKHTAKSELNRTAQNKTKKMIAKQMFAVFLVMLLMGTRCNFWILFFFKWMPKWFAAVQLFRMNALTELNQFSINANIKINIQRSMSCEMIFSISWAGDFSRSFQFKREERPTKQFNLSFWNKNHRIRYGCLRLSMYAVITLIVRCSIVIIKFHLTHLIWLSEYTQILKPLYNRNKSKL